MGLIAFLLSFDILSRAIFRSFSAVDSLEINFVFFSLNVAFATESKFLIFLSSSISCFNFSISFFCL